MSNLLNTDEGRSALLVAQRFQLERRLSRFFHRTIVIDFSRYKEGLSEFDLSTMLGALNSAHDQEIIDMFRLLGAVGGLNSSIADMTYYVDGTLGSDLTGTGSAARPFASLWFVGNLPRAINHKYRVVLSSDISEPTQSLVFDFDFGDAGSFALIGSGAPTLIATSAITAISPSTNLGMGSITKPNPWAPGTPYFCLSTNAGSRYAVPAFKELGARTIIPYVEYTVIGIAPGDVVSAAIPVRTLTVNSLITNCRGSNKQGRAQFCIVNLNISFAPLAAPVFEVRPRMFSLNNDCVSHLSFVRFNDWEISATGRSVIANGELNTDIPIDTQIDVLANSNVSNLYASPSAPYLPTCAGVLFGSIGTQIQYMEARETEIQHCTSHTGILCTGRNIVSNSMAWVIYAAQGNLFCSFCGANGYSSADPKMEGAGFVHTMSKGELLACDVLMGDNVVSAGGNCEINLGMVGSDAVMASIDNVGVWLEGKNQITGYWGGTTPVAAGCTGSNGDIASFKTTTPAPGLTFNNFGAVDVPVAAGHNSVTRME